MKSSALFCCGVYDFCGICGSRRMIYVKSLQLEMIYYDQQHRHPVLLPLLLHDQQHPLLHVMMLPLLPQHLQHALLLLD